MKRRTRSQPRHRRGELSRPQEFELISTCNSVIQHFADEEDRRAAWLEFRDVLLANERPGKRPAAWWWYEHRDERPSCYEEQTPALYLLGEATQADIDDLARAAHYFTETPELCYWSAEHRQRIRATLAAWNARNGSTMPSTGAVGRAARF